MTTRLIASSLAAPQKISVNTTFSKPLDSTGPFYVQPGLTSKNVLATVNLKSIGDVAAANTTLMLPKASTDYTFKTASGAVTISTKAVGTTKAVVIASLDLTTVQKTNGIETGGNNTPSVQFTDLTAKFHYVSAVKKTATAPAVAAYIELTSLKLANDNGTSATDGVSNDGKINLVSQTGTTYSYSVDGGKTYTAVTGTSIDLQAKKYAALDVKWIEKDAKGNIVNAATNANAIDINKAVLTQPTIKLNADTAITTDRITSDGLVNVSGTSANVSYSIDAGKTFNPLTGSSFSLKEGVYTAGQVVVKQTDIYGSSAVAPLGNVTVDRTAPTVPVIKLDSDTGISDKDSITKDGTITVTGTETGATISFSIDSGKTFTSATGTSFTLKDGVYEAGQVVVKQTDVAGNASATTSLRALTVDTKADDLSIALAEDTGSEIADGITSKATVNVTGLEVGATWQYRIKAGDFVDGTGTSFDLPEDDTYNVGDILVRQTDKAGNVSEVESTNSIDWTLDTKADDLSIALAEDTGSDIADGITSKATVNVTGLEDGATWQYSVNGVDFVDGMGTSFDLPANLTYDKGDILVRQTDIAGNETEVEAYGTNSIDWTVDTEAKAVSIELAVDTGISDADGITYNGTVNVTNFETQAEVMYSIDTGKTWNTVTDGTFNVPEGKYAEGDILVAQIDAAGNESEDTALVGALIVDTKADDLSIALAEDTGTSATDSITKVGTVNVTGLEDGATWQYSLNGASFVDGTGTSFDLPADLTYGKGDILVRQIDIAGNETEVEAYGTNSVDWTLDSTADDLSIALAEDTGSSATDGVTKVATVKIANLEDGATWQYSINDVEFVDGMGTSFNLPEDGEFAAGKVLVKQTDVAGNVSATAYLDVVTLDTVAPAKLIDVDINDTGIDGDYITSLAKVTVNDLEDKATLYYNIDGSDKFTAATDNTFVVPNGTYAAGKIQWKQADLAGNTGVVTSSSVKIVANDIVNVTTENPSVFDAGNANINFVVKAGNYTYNIANFGTDDKIDFPTGTPPTVINSSNTDNAVNLQYANDGKITLLHLTGLTTAQDAAIYSVNSFNTAFGANSLTSTGSSSIPAPVVTHQAVSAAGTASASTGNIVFDFAEGTYNYSVTDFASGDGLNFPTDVAPTVINSDATDKKVDVQWASNGKVVVVSVTGLTDAQDGAIYSANSFKTLFGASSLTNTGAPPVTPTGNALAVSAAGSATASAGDVKFTFAAGNYAYSISGFSNGDILDFPDDVAATVRNTSTTDNSIDVQWASGGNVVLVTLTGLATDTAYSVNSFNAAFGTGSII